MGNELDVGVMHNTVNLLGILKRKTVGSFRQRLHFVKNNSGLAHLVKTILYLTRHTLVAIPCQDLRLLSASDRTG